MRVLCDYAHADLWESMVMLFEDRYGWKLYRPIGMDWYSDGIWRFEHDRHGDAVARQFLQAWSDDTETTDHWLRQDVQHGRTMKMVTLDQARSQAWDLVIATLAENEAGLRGFAAQVGATYGIQVGNQDAPNNWTAAQFALLSVTTPGFTPWIPHVTYHQEFSTELFRPGPSTERDMIATRVQCFNGTPDYARFVTLAGLAPEFRWLHYGHCGERDIHWGGDAATTAEIAAGMRAARIAYHVKRWSDGYGHVIHNWFAIGRPVLGSSSYYRDKLAGPLFWEGVTSFDIDMRSDAEVIELVRQLAGDDDYYQRICENAQRRFVETVDFAAEAAEIRAMLDNVLSDRKVAA